MTRRRAMLALQRLAVGLVAYLAVVSLTATPAAATPRASSRPDHGFASAAAASDKQRKSLCRQEQLSATELGITDELVGALIHAIRAAGAA